MATKRRRTEPPKLRLLYFDIQGPAEAARLALTIGGVAFEDVRLSREEFQSMKAAGSFPCGQVPVLEVNGEKLSQSGAIASYCGRLAGLYPSDVWDAARCDEVVQFVNQDIRDRSIGPTLREQDLQKRAAMRKELATMKLPALFDVLERFLQPSGFFVGDSLTMADLHAYAMLNWLGMETLDGVPRAVVTDRPKLAEFVRKMDSVPAVATWNARANRGKLPWLPASQRIRVILGTMTMGPTGQTDKATAEKQLEVFLGCSAVHVSGSAPGELPGCALMDTARIYQDGATEELLGGIMKQQGSSNKFCLHTKVNQAISPLHGSGVREQVDACLKALDVKSVQIMYVHSPDIQTPIEETFAALDACHREGKFVELGLSNYAGWDVMRIWNLCKERGWVRPTVYQGMYNGITRSVERELFPALRSCGMRFYAYNPMAGGLLSGKYRSMGDAREEGSRFSSSYHLTDKMKVAGDKPTHYQGRYWKREIFAALDVLHKACDAEGITMAEAALRWMMHHSALSAKHGDGIIVGASQLKHLEANLAAIQQPPLSGALVEAFDAASRVAYAEAEIYFRGYGPAPGDSSKFLGQFS